MSSYLKRSLLQACAAQVEKRINTIKSQLNLIEESRNNETKSSVGDKYEIGRAMMQMEEDKARAQMQEALNVKQVLQGIDPKKANSVVELGSLITTSNGTYFISVGIGKVTLDNTLYYCISPESPISRALKGVSVGEQLIFRGQDILILDVL